MTEENFVSYELMLIVDPAIGEDKTREEVEKVKEMITSAGGKITYEELWGVRYLSYKIRRNDRGYYVVLNFNVAPNEIKEMSRDLLLDQTVLRFLVTKTPKNYETKTLESLEQEKENFRKERKEKNKKEGAEPAPVPQKRAPIAATATPVADAPAPVSTKVEEVKEKKAEKKVEVEPEVEEEKVAVEEIKEEVEEEPVEEKTVEEPKEEPKKEPKKTPKLEISDLDDVDAKLKSIIDDPDISL